MLQPQHAKPAASSTAPKRSLRDEMERRRASGNAFSLPDAVALIVPLCLDLRDRHTRGERFFAYPSSILVGSDGLPQLDPRLAKTLATLPRDRACLAPEERHGEAGDRRSSVFAVGAILYELLTAESVGPGMRRPTEIIPGLDPGIEQVLGKALVTDRAHRPDDLGALAQALHHFAPTASMPPPAADESHLDTGADFQVDISLSMLPPAPGGAVHFPHPPHAPADLHVPGADPMAMPVMDAPAAALVRHADDPTARLADLKARLESDPRPRYVVIKDGMDHGPFNAVELLQQIGSHKFLGKHVLRDAFSGEEQPISEWGEFSLFADHAKLNREIVAEKRAIERVVVTEAKGTRRKMVFGVAVLAGILAIGGAWYAVKRGSRNEAIEVAGEDGINVDVAGGLKGAKGKAKPGGRVGTGPGGIPFLAGGMSCEQARDRYVEEINIGGGKQGQADLTANQLGAVLNNGSYVIACGTPMSMHVNICAAIQNGRAVGVTVTTEPPDGRIAGCIAGRVRGMSYPSNPKLDITRTRF